MVWFSLPGCELHSPDVSFVESVNGNHRSQEHLVPDKDLGLRKHKTQHSKIITVRMNLGYWIYNEQIEKIR